MKLLRLYQVELEGQTGWENFGLGPGDIQLPYTRQNGINMESQLDSEETMIYSDIVFAFWDGESRGTEHDLGLAEKFGKQIFLYNYGKY